MEVTCFSPSAKKTTTGLCHVSSAYSFPTRVLFWFILLLVFAYVSSHFITNRPLSTTTAATIAFFSSISGKSVASPPHSSSPPPFSCPKNSNQPPPTCSSTTTSPAIKKHPFLRGLTLAPPSPSCPEYFRWIYEDLRPWAATGISKNDVERARPEAAFRLIVSGGRAYIERYHRVFQTRDTFTIWGILQLLRRYPGGVPDVDIMFNCEDMPVVKEEKYYRDVGSAAEVAVLPPPPPLFRYCKDDTTVDIVFPDWSFWGWPEVNIRPWVTVMSAMKNANKKMKWESREPYAYWKGNPDVSPSRMDLLKCNLSDARDWNARLYVQNWDKETKEGFKNSDLVDQCVHRYKIYVEGRSWSVSLKYILACDSPALVVNTPYVDFFSRGLEPRKHYWPISRDHKCGAIEFAVDWGNQHVHQAQAMGKAGSLFIAEDVKMDYVYSYMFHLLSEYSKLMTYKPSIPTNAVELCMDMVACEVGNKEREFLMESMVPKAADSEPPPSPCKMPPPFSPGDLVMIQARRANVTRDVEYLSRERKRS